MLRRHSPTLVSAPAASVPMLQHLPRESADINIFDQVRVRRGPSPPAITITSNATTPTSAAVVASAATVASPPRRRPSKSDKRDFLRRRPAPSPAAVTPRAVHQEHVHERSIAYLPPPLQPRRSRSYDRLPPVAAVAVAPHHHINKQPLKSILKLSASTPVLPSLAAAVVEEHDTFGRPVLRAVYDAGRAESDGGDKEVDGQMALEQFLRLEQRGKQTPAVAAATYPPRGHSLNPTTKIRGNPATTTRPPLPPTPQSPPLLPQYQATFRSRRPATGATTMSAATHVRNLSNSPPATDDTEGWSDLARAIATAPYRFDPTLFSPTAPS
ncbi:hypothetical protein HK405_001694, partial [Cladochytrium tenue]